MQLQLFDSLSTKALENVRSAIVVTESACQKNQIIYMNPAFEALTGYGTEDVLGRNCRFLQGSDTDQPACYEIRAALANGRAAHGVFRNYRKDGSLFYNELFIDPICDQGGAVTHFVGCQNQIDDLEKAYVLQNAYAGMARLTAREREVFLLIVSGNTSKSIGRVLRISPRTAEKHRLAIFKKFGVSDVTLLVRYTIALGLPFTPHDAGTAFYPH
jgi:PAS domain S-box-containing protein